MGVFNHSLTSKKMNQMKKTFEMTDKPWLTECCHHRRAADEISDKRFDQNMTGQPSVYRTFRIMYLLSSGVYRSVEDLMKDIDCSRSTVKRSISTLRKAGYNVECIDGRYRITHINPSLEEFSQIVHFSEEEAYIIDMAIDSICPSNRMKGDLKDKLMSVYDTCSLQRYSLSVGLSERISTLNKAIRNKEQVMLRNYCSSHSDSVKDRMVEPFSFTLNCKSLAAYDLEDGKVKFFSPSRMASVEQLGRKWEHEDRHRMPDTDIFEMSGDRNIHVRILLTARAKNLLEEEYPKSVPFISESVQGRWILETDLCSPEGACRFVTGLPQDTTVQEGEAVLKMMEQWYKETSMKYQFQDQKNN